MTTVPLCERLALSPAEAAALIGVSESTIRRLVAEGVIARVAHFEPMRISRVELDRVCATKAVAA